MFKKPFKATASNVVKRSVKRNLVNQLKKDFPNLSEEEWQELLPGKQDLMLCKVAGSHTIIYSVNGMPYFFDVDGRNDYYPTVYILWRYPKLMDTLVVQPNTFNFLLRGADLFLPGVLVPEGGLEWRVGAKLSVTLLLYGLPIAVGKSLIDNKHVAQQGMKGKGVKIVHYYKDNLWELGDKSHPQQQIGWKMERQWPGFEKHYSEFQSKDFDFENLGGDVGDGEGEGEEDDADGGAQEVEKSGKEEEKEEKEEKEEDGEKEEKEEPVSVTAEEMDERVKAAFYTALKVKLKKSDVPILVNLFWADFVLPCAGSTQVDIKHSTYKKLTSFLSEMSEKGIIKMEEPSPGVHQIVSFDRRQEDVHAFKVDEALAEALAAASGTSSAPSSSNQAAAAALPASSSSYTTSAVLGEERALIVELFGAPQSLQQLFLSLGQEKRHLYTKKEATELLWQYTEKNSLSAQGGKACRLDELLARALFKKGQEPPEIIPKKELADLFVSKLTAFHEVNRENVSEIRKGAVKPIVIALEARQGGRKHVTRISGLESFAVSPETLAEELRHACAASTTVKPLEGKTGGVEVLVQGLAVKQSTEHLIKKYQIPRKYVHNVDKSKKKGGK